MPGTRIGSARTLIGALSPQLVLRAAGRVLQLAFDLLGLAIDLQLGIAYEFADDFLH